MLLLSRKKGEVLVIDDNIKIKIIDIEGEQVKLGIDAPKNIKIWRYEIYEEIEKENIKAVSSKSKLKDIGEYLKG